MYKTTTILNICSSFVQKRFALLGYIRYPTSFLLKKRFIFPYDIALCLAALGEQIFEIRLLFLVQKNHHFLKSLKDKTNAHVPSGAWVVLCLFSDWVVVTLLYR